MTQWFTLRMFTRLPPETRPGDVVELEGSRWRVETAKVAEDLRDAKCVVVLLPVTT